MSNPIDIPFQQILDALLDEDTRLHPRYLYRLSDLESSDLILLEQTWPNIPLWRRQALLEDLGDLGEADMVLSFEAIGRFAIFDEDPKVRISAIRLLWDFEPIDLIPRFLHFLEHDPSAEVRAAAANILGYFIYMGEIEELSKESQRIIEDSMLETMASEEKDLVRQCCLEALGYSSRPEVPGLISNAFASKDQEWIRTALVAMGRSIDERWREDILSMLDDKRPALRAEAATAAGDLELNEALPRLIELTEDSDQAVRLAAIWSLSQIGGTGVRLVLETLWEKAEDDREIDFIENAMDNLAFTDVFGMFSLFDLPDQELSDEDMGSFLEDEFLFDDEEFDDLDDEDLLD